MKYSKTVQKGLDYIAIISATELSPLVENDVSISWFYKAVYASQRSGFS
jgi:hypothetical protein